MDVETSAVNTTANFEVMISLLLDIESRIRNVEALSTKTANRISRMTNESNHHTKVAKITSGIVRLAKKLNRPVALDEVIDFLVDVEGIQLGNSRRKQKTKVVANISLELRRQNPRIVRVDRGYYDVKR